MKNWYQAPVFHFLGRGFCTLGYNRRCFTGFRETGKNMKTSEQTEIEISRAAEFILSNKE